MFAVRSLFLVRRSSMLAITLCVTGAVAGCRGGTDGPPRFHLAGSVEFEGKPVPAGMVYIDADSSKSNSGPQGFAPIVNGKFDTRQGKGHVGGPSIVRITGLPSAPSSAATVTDDSGKPPLFPEYKESVSLDKKDASRSFTVVPQITPQQQQPTGGTVLP
jgi:hypothetical protein